MSMTREEAITILQEKYDYCKSFYDLAAHPEEDYPEMAKYLQALQIALSALRPVSREKVEKVWRGEWIQGGYACGEHEWECSKCHETEWRTSCSRLKFCPFCGASMTDEAVDIRLKELEALKDGKAGRCGSIRKKD